MAAPKRAKNRGQAQKPTLHLAGSDGPRPPSVEDITKLYKALTGKDPTPDEIARAIARRRRGPDAPTETDSPSSPARQPRILKEEDELAYRRRPPPASGRRR